MPYYRVCPFCGSNLDPGEICDCKTQDSDKEETAAVIPTAAGSIALVAESRIQYAKESRAGYSNCNIREKTLLECLQSPIFMAYHDGQPFNKNQLRPCPMLENPELLRAMVKCTGAHSTDLQSPESVDHLCNKCVPYAQSWKPTADRLWEESPASKKNPE